MIFEKVVRYIADHFDIDESEITGETTFEELQAQDEDIIDMMFELSREFDIILDEDDLYGITDVGGLVDVIKSVME
jgi:acyl carrier protein